MNMRDGGALRRGVSFVAATTLGLVVLADFLFYDAAAGWTVALFALVLLAAVTVRDGRYLRRWPGRVVAVAVLGLIVALLVQPGPLAVGLGMLGLITLASIDRSGWTASVAEWLWRWVTFIGRGLTQGLRDARVRQRWHRTHGSSPRQSGAAWRGWAVPLLLAGVFVVLFAVANPVVQRAVQSGWDEFAARLQNVHELLAPGRIVLWLVTAAGAWGLLRVRTRRRRGRIEANRLTRGWDRLEMSTGTGWIVRSLVLFNAVFAVQTSLDLMYLWGGVSLPEGMTYAQYAHRGAYPLVVTALLAGGFVLLTFRPGGAAQRSAPARRLVGFWIAQNIVLMVSAAWRLNLYVEAYSLTRWRVAAAVWMLLVAAGFAWLIWRIVAGRDNGWLLQRVTLTGAAVLYAACFVNLDGFIARYNVGHCAEMGGTGPSLDLTYLQRLGPPALPATRRLLAEASLDPHRRQDAERVHATLRAELDRHLADWRAWTVRRAALAAR